MIRNSIITVTREEVLNQNFEKEDQFYKYLSTKMIKENKLDLEVYILKVISITKHLYLPQYDATRFLIRYDLKYKYNFFKRILRKVKRKVNG